MFPLGKLRRSDPEGCGLALLCSHRKSGKIYGLQGPCSVHGVVPPRRARGWGSRELVGGGGGQGCMAGSPPPELGGIELSLLEMKLSKEASQRGNQELITLLTKLGTMNVRSPLVGKQKDRCGFPGP